MNKGSFLIKIISKLFSFCKMYILYVSLKQVSLIPYKLYRLKDDHVKTLFIKFYCPTLNNPLDIKGFKMILTSPLKVPHN